MHWQCLPHRVDLLHLPAGRSGRTQSSLQGTYSEDLDLPSGSLGLGVVESESNLVTGFDDDSQSDSVF